MDTNENMLIITCFLIHTIVILVAGTPDSCQEAKNQVTNAVDGEYTLRVDGSLGRIYCHDMDTSDPKEYITLPAGPSENFGSFETVRDNTPSRRASFSKIRIDISTMEVVKEDYTFATVAAGGGEALGLAVFCGYHSGTVYYEWTDMKINLTGTDFAFHSSVTFGTNGYFNPSIGQGHYLTEHPGRQVVECSVSGECGSCGPSPSYDRDGVLKLTETIDLDLDQPPPYYPTPTTHPTYNAHATQPYADTTHSYAHLEDLSAYCDVDPDDFSNYNDNAAIPLTTSVAIDNQDNPPEFSWITTQAAFCTTFCFCPVLSLIGLIYAIHAYVDYKAKDYEESKSKLRMAKSCVLLSIPVGILFWILLSWSD